MKNRHIVLLLIVSILNFVGCSVSTEKPSTEQTGSIDLTMPEYKISNVNLESNEGTIQVLDSQDDIILYAVEQRYANDDTRIDEQAIRRYTKGLVKFSIKDEKIIDEYVLPADMYCSDAVLTDSGFDFIQIATLSKNNGNYQYDICRKIGEQIKIIEQSEYFLFGIEPYLTSLGSNSTAYSYHNPITADCGVSVIQPDNSIESIVQYKASDSVVPLEFNLLGNGTQFVYYIGIDKIGTLIIGDAKNKIAEIKLQPNEKIYGFTLTKDKLLLSTITPDMQGDEKQRNTALKGMLSLIDWDGNKLCSKEYFPLYHMQSDGGNLALAVSSEQTLEVIQVQGSSFRIDKISEYMENDTALMFPMRIKEKELLIYRPRKNDIKKISFR